MSKSQKFYNFDVFVVRSLLSSSCSSISIYQQTTHARAVTWIVGLDSKVCNAPARSYSFVINPQLGVYNGNATKQIFV